MTEKMIIKNITDKTVDKNKSHELFTFLIFAVLPFQEIKSSG